MIPDECVTPQEKMPMSGTETANLCDARRDPRRFDVFPNFPSQMSRLPQDIYNIIIDNVEDDNKKEELSAVLTITLVCRSWAKSSRRRLFHTLKVTDENNQALFALLRSRLTTFKFLRVNTLKSSSTTRPGS